ncbi:MAG: hypothetical protein KDA24_06675 [Deltaproteobacteria bacterium]|nr:hypothetical protein [Deltaproteobacteria bacterium]
MSATSLRLACALALFGLVGCPENTTDIDGDGVPAGDLDCNDLDPTVNYLAPELCDGIDNDCDGEIDEGAAPVDGEWYHDNDGDGFGCDLVEEPGCDPAADGYIQDNTDCDDTDPATFPGAPDTCNGDGVDNDCDGDVDEDADADADGVDSSACGGTDCDDTDPTVLPGADELCDGIDNDCDGALSTEDDEDDTDEDGFLGCLDDCDDDAPLVFPGAKEVCDTIDQDCDEIVDDNIDGDGDGFTDCATSGGALDIVVVVDNSGSMEDNQTQLVAQVGTLFDNLVAEALDYRMIIVTTDDPTARGGVISAGPGARGVFIANATPGTMGSGTEKPFENALGGALGTTDFLREGASKAILIVSDEDDQSSFGIPGGVDTLLGLVGGIDAFIKVSGITGGPAGCSDPPASAVPSIRTNAFIDATGGSWASICGADWFVELGFDLLPETGIDCDDEDPATFPGADEICDGIDNDCDGTNDEDGDGDGVDPCDGTPDCDEDDPLTFPGAPEICDSIDNDCDGALNPDEIDGDLDGVLICDGDCDDSDDTVFPGAAEICGDSIDQNCNGDDGTGADLLDTDGDLFTPCEGDCDDGSVVNRPFAQEDPLDGIDNDCDGLVDGEDQSLPYTFSSTAGLTQFFGLENIDFCGQTHNSVTVNRFGVLTVGTSTTASNDSSPTAAEFGQYAPALAPGWEAPPVDVTVEVEVAREPERFSAFYTWIGPQGEAVASFEAHIEYPGTFMVFVPQKTGGDGILGFSCGGDIPVELAPNYAKGGISPLSTGISEFSVYEGGMTPGRYLWE